MYFDIFHRLVECLFGLVRLFFIARLLGHKQRLEVQFGDEADIVFKMGDISNVYSVPIRVVMIWARIFCFPYPIVFRHVHVFVFVHIMHVCIASHTGLIGLIGSVVWFVALRFDPIWVRYEAFTLTLFHMVRFVVFSVALISDHALNHYEAFTVFRV